MTTKATETKTDETQDAPPVRHARSEAPAPEAPAPVVAEGAIEVPTNTEQFNVGTADDPERALKIPH